jgi:hypothetical protein
MHQKPGYKQREIANYSTFFKGKCIEEFQAQFITRKENWRILTNKEFI